MEIILDYFGSARATYSYFDVAVVQCAGFYKIIGIAQI